MKGLIGLALGVGLTYWYFKHTAEADALAKSALNKTRILLDGDSKSLLPKAVPESFTVQGSFYALKDGKFLKQSNTKQGWETIELTPEEFKMAYDDNQESFM